MLRLLIATTGATPAVQTLWILGAIFFVTLALMIYRQQVLRRQLKADLAELDKLTQTDVENEFVLKAMKVAVWRYDASTQAFVYETDYREGINSYVPESDETYGQTLNAIAPADLEHVNRSFSNLCEGRSDSYHEEYQVINKAFGTSYWEESYATVVDRDADGKPSKIVGTSMRIDQRKEMEAALVQARIKAEESDRLKTAFLANMGHEIRTPLNAIVGFADLLPVVQTDEERNQLITEIQNNNAKLLRIIDGLVSMSEIEAGAKNLKMAAIDLNQVLLQMVDTYQPTASATLSVQLPLDQMQMTTDSAKLMEIIDNMVQNAVKFTPEGSIILGYDIEENNQVRIWVADTGKGIAPEDQERIFERFVKVDEYIPGTGLGLSVIKSHAASLGGSVGVESALGQGSRFWVLLPLT